MRWGCVNISSNNSIAAYYCYVNAFKKNGFSTEIKAPESDKQENFVVDFIKDIHMVLNLGLMQKEMDMVNRIDHKHILNF